MLISLLLSLFVRSSEIDPIVIVPEEEFEAVWIPAGWSGPWVAIPSGDETGLGQ